MGINGILLLDKEEGWTSQDCAAKLRGVLGERRVGHAGTLDPMATGLLVILAGRATRAAAWAEAEVKEYVASFRPGLVTDTQDTTGRILRRSDDVPSREQMQAALPLFTGRIEQIPPMYSAVKIRGKKLYEIARRGGEVERAPRPVTIHSIDYLGSDGTDHILRIRCSKGTYIRTLCHDIGEALGCGGCMAALRRTASGSFRVEDARTIGTITRENAHILPIDVLFQDAPPMTLTEAQTRHCRCGSAFSSDAPDGEKRFYAPDGSFLALGTVENGRARTIKSFFEVDR